MIRWVLIILCAILALQCAAQKGIPYDQYKAEDKIVHYYADFNTDNDTLWMDVPYEGGHSRIINGNFLYNVKKGELLAQGFQPQVDENRDFEVEFAAQIVGENRRNTHGILFWGRADTFKSFYWYFWTNQNTIFQCENKTDCPDRLWKAKRTKREGFNKYTLRKISDSMYAYVNEVQLGSFAFQPFFGRNF